MNRIYISEEENEQSGKNEHNYKNVRDIGLIPT